MAKKGKKASKKAAKKKAKKRTMKKMGDEGGPFPWAWLNRFLGFRA